MYGFFKKNIYVFLLPFMLIFVFSINVYAVEIVDDKQNQFTINDIRIEGVTNNIANVGQELKIQCNSNNYYNDGTQFEFSYLKDSESVIIQPYSTKNECTWKPEEPGTYFIVINNVYINRNFKYTAIRD